MWLRIKESYDGTGGVMESADTIMRGRKIHGRVDEFEPAVAL